MTNYISADIRRVLHKPSFFYAVGVFVLLFAVLIFIYFNPAFTAEIYAAKVTSFFSFFPLLIGTLVFISVYADDFKYRSMQTAIGYGMSRSRIILAKLQESTILLLCATAVMEVLILGTPMLLGLAPNSQQIITLALTAATEMFRALGYIALSAIPVFFFQDAVGGIVVYVLLASKTIYIVLSMILGQGFFIHTMGDLTKYLYTAWLYLVRSAFIQGEPFMLSFLFALLLYVILPTIIAIIGFHKKELEF